MTSISDWVLLSDDASLAQAARACRVCDVRSCRGPTGGCGPTTSTIWCRFAVAEQCPPHRRRVRRATIAACVSAATRQARRRSCTLPRARASCGSAPHRGARPARAAARGRQRQDRDRRRRRAGDPQDVGARRAADRRRRRLRSRAGARSRPERRRARTGPCRARRNAADGRQPALGARPRPRRRCSRCRRPRAPTRRGAKPTRSPRKTRRSTTRSGSHGLALLRDIARRRPGPVRVMTHCNAGALATCGWGTATAPLFLAHAAGLPLHVWVSETRPRTAGREPHGVGDGSPRHPAHALRRRRERAADARAATSTSSSSAPIASPQTATSATRSARMTRRSPRATTACRSTSRCRRPRSTPGSPRGDAIPIETRTGRSARRHRTRRLRADGHSRDRAGRNARRQLRVRRDARAARNRTRHRARHRRRATAVLCARCFRTLRMSDHGDNENARARGAQPGSETRAHEHGCRPRAKRGAEAVR